MSGTTQVMTALLEGELPHPYMADTFDCELVEVGDGHAIFQATPQLKHYNPLGSVHGGWYATLLDSAGVAVLNVQDGILLQDLPFTVSLRKFHLEHYDTGMPMAKSD